MANRHWVNSGVDSNWSNVLNWSSTLGGVGGSSIPTSTDNVYFDGGSNNNCTLDSSSGYCQSLNVSTAYVKTLNLSSNYLTITNDMVLSFGTSGIINWGNGLTAIGGNLDFRLMANVTLDQGWLCSTNHDMKFTGTSKTLYCKPPPAPQIYLGKLTIDGTITASGNYISPRDTLTVNVGKSLNIATHSVNQFGGMAIYGSMIGNTLYCKWNNPYTFIMGSTASIGNTIYFRPHNYSGSFTPPCTFNGSFVLWNYIDTTYTGWKPLNGTYTFNGVFYY